MQRIKHLLHSRWAMPVLLAVLVLVAAPVLAQQGGDYTQTWYTVQPGQVVSNPTTGYRLRGVVGQPDVNTTPNVLSGGTYQLVGGFLGAVQATAGPSPTPIQPSNDTVVYLPFIAR